MTCCRRREEGSVLIIVLMLMVISMSLALYTVSVSRDMVRTAGQLMDNLQARLESGSTLEKLKFIGRTRRFSISNLENWSGNKEFPMQMNLRGTPFLVGNSELRLQDSAGKLGLWPPDSVMLRKLLLAGGLKPSEATVAVDSLMDWIDADDLKRLNGAERYFYRSEESSNYQPRNDRFIQTRQELELIKGFRGKAYDLLKDELIDTDTGTVNYNTAGAPLLAALFGIDLDAAARLVQLREKKGFLSQGDVIAEGANGLTFLSESFTVSPSMKLGIDIRTRVNEAGDSLRALISFRSSKQRPYTIEKFEE